MGPDLSDEAETAQRGLCIYSHTVKRGKVRDGAENARSRCFAENSENEAFSELSVL